MPFLAVRIAKVLHTWDFVANMFVYLMEISSKAFGINQCKHDSPGNAAETFGTHK